MTGVLKATPRVDQVRSGVLNRKGQLHPYVEYRYQELEPSHLFEIRSHSRWCPKLAPNNRLERSWVVSSVSQGGDR
jgi:hypothetical protein